MKTRFLPLLLVSCLALVAPARAATLISDSADNSLNGSAMDSVTNFDLTLGGNGGYTRSVIPFLLPNLGAGSFSDVSFSFYLTGVTTSTFNFAVNLIGLSRIDASPTVLSTDSAGATTLLETGLADTFTPVGWVTTSSPSTISGWLNNQYANGANAGKYVFIAITANTSNSSPTYDFYSASAPGTGADPFGIYTFTAVPEPSTYGLIGAGLFAGVSLFKKRKQK